MPRTRTEAPALDAPTLRAAVQLANVPTLLMVLFQMTGERRWLEAPYRPSRSTGLGDNDSGGLPEDVQQSVRDAAFDAIAAWQDGRPLAIERPDDAQLVDMLSVAMGEPVPPEYGEFTASLLGERAVPDEPVEVPAGFHVLIVGAGMSGLCAGVYLKAAGIPFTILEKNAEIGGVWLENHYPGAGVDTPNHLYAYSFAVHDWPVYFALRDDIHDYFSQVTERYGLREHIRFDTRVDTARWDEAEQRWQVEAHGADGRAERHQANVLISASGIFNPPVWPDIPGLDDFAGPRFHTAEWQDDIAVDGKRVAIIGNGASCMQIGTGNPAPGRNQLTIFQRSNHWAAPFAQFRRKVPDRAALPAQARSAAVPGVVSRTPRLDVQRSHARLGAAERSDDWQHHAERSLNATNDAHRAYFTDLHQGANSATGRTCSRRCLPHLPAVRQAHAAWTTAGTACSATNGSNLVDDRVRTHRRPIAIITADGTANSKPMSSCIATGFDVLRFHYHVRRDRAFDGRSLRETWEDDNATCLPRHRRSRLSRISLRCTVRICNRATAAASFSSLKCRCTT